VILIAAMIIIIVTMIAIKMIIILAIIYHSTLDFLRIEFYSFSMYDIFNLITWVTSLKS
jgi:hypothetical protein